MSNRFLTLCLISLCLIAPALTKPARAEGRKLAVVVGVNTYRASSGLPPLKQAAGDAVKLSKVLREQGFTVYEMTHEAARQPGSETLAPNIAYIRDQIDGMLGYPNLGADDSIFITLHGHGVQFEQISTVQVNGKPVEKKTPKFYFCPADATVQGVQTANELTEANHLLPLDELYKSLGDCKAATKLLIVDACRNDPTQPGVFRSGLASATLPKLPPPPGGTAAFFSCKANERAVEDPVDGGVFTHFLVLGLQGRADQPLEGQPADGIVTFSELTTYVANNTYPYVYKKYTVKQTPELRGEYDLNLPLSRIVTNRLVSKTTGMEFALIPAGTFMMGSPESETDRSTDEQQHRVTISKPFLLGKTEVTQGQWQTVMGTTPWQGQEYVKTGKDYPATYVSWDDAQEFCRRLSEKDGRTYKLPTEAQWEYACRSGSSSVYAFGDSTSSLKDYAWFDVNAYDVDEKYAHLVGQKRANAFGLFDMHGNVWEWCGDWYDAEYYAKSLTSDPPGASEGSFRVSRGGSWDSDASRCRAALRVRDSPTSRSRLLGFRVQVPSQ